MQLPAVLLFMLKHYVSMIFLVSDCTSDGGGESESEGAGIGGGGGFLDFFSG